MLDFQFHFLVLYCWILWQDVSKQLGNALDAQNDCEIFLCTISFFNMSCKVSLISLISIILF